MFASDKRSNLRGLLVSYEENGVLWIQYLEPYSQHFIFLETYIRPSKLECFLQKNLSALV